MANIINGGAYGQEIRTGYNNGPHGKDLFLRGLIVKNKNKNEDIPNFKNGNTGYVSTLTQDEQGKWQNYLNSLPDDKRTALLANIGQDGPGKDMLMIDILYKTQNGGEIPEYLFNKGLDTDG